MSFDFIENSEELPNLTEIVNDVISHLNVKDRQILEITARSELQLKFPEWANHIKNFYMLWRLDNPVTLGIGVDAVVLQIMEAVWAAVHSYKPTTEYA